MPVEHITGYRVFIASPGGLEKERRAFRQVLLLYNETDAIHEGVLFIPMGWEDTLGGIGRPQAIINEDLRQCDFAIVLLHNRWGSPPDRYGSRFTSGTEEEFHTAMECQRDDRHPMRQVVTFFKAVAPRHLVTPDEQLTKVLEFRKSLEGGKEHLFHVFDTLRSFEGLLRRHLGAWLRSIRNGGTPAAVPTGSGIAVRSAAGRDLFRASGSVQALINEAEDLANTGMLVEAEALLARLAIRDRNPEGLVAYGRWLIRAGRLQQARDVLEEGVAVSETEGNLLNAATARRWTGMVLERLGNLSAAGEMYQKTLEILERLGDQEGMALILGHLGSVLYRVSDLDGAEETYQRALEINLRLGRREHAAKNIENIDRIIKERGGI